MCKVLRGDRPDRPPSGFTDPLWELLTATWLVEHGSQSPKRPQISAILGRLNEEVENWGTLIVPPRVVESTGRVGYRIEDDGGFFCSFVSYCGADLRMKQSAMIQWSASPSSPLKTDWGSRSGSPGIVMLGNFLGFGFQALDFIDQLPGFPENSFASRPPPRNENGEGDR